MLNYPRLYYITDRTQLAHGERERKQLLIAKIAEAARCGVDFIQLREKDLSSRELEELAKHAAKVIRTERTAGGKPGTRLLINSRSDIALAVGVDGVHLRSQDISVHDARRVYELCAVGERKPRLSANSHDGAKALPNNNSPSESSGGWFVAVSCHSEDEVRAAAADAADFVVFAPVFQKKGGSPTGLDALRRACQYRVPVLALGGITLENVQSCLDVGVAGVAGIRLFQQDDISELVRHVRRS